jgi:arylsulfatase A-like enzyme/Tfp pilus assembly protein PilF
MGSMKRILPLFLLVGLARAADPVPVKAAVPAHPNVILITLDTTRADRMGFLGSDRGLTPNLDRLARHATVFPRAYAQVPLTSPSHAALLSGTYPQFNHVNYMGDPLDKTIPFLPEIFHRHGYKTAAFVGALVLDPAKLAPGFERGFDAYDAGFHRRSPGEDTYHAQERRGGEVVNRAVAWLKKRPAGPFFLWVHLYDPHDPYDPPPPYRTLYRDAPYDGEIAYTDSVVGKLLTALWSQGLFSGSLIAVMADHGEAFGEHGENHHGIFLYDETIHVPLLFKLPGQQVARRIETRVGLVDVAPSILKAVRIPVPAAMQGKSVLTDHDGDSGVPRAIYSESGYGHLSFGWSMLKSWRAGNYLYIEAPDRELYNQNLDPQAKHNLAADSKAVVETTAAQLADFQHKTAAASGDKPRLTAEQSESLHAMGYIGSSTAPVVQGNNESGPDPKQRIATANLLYQALVYSENQRYAEAVPILEEVLRQEPNTSMAYMQLGRAYVALEQYQKAIPPLQYVVDKVPDNALARYELGCALVKTGQWNEAAPQFEAAVSQLNGSSMMHFYLAFVYERTSRPSEAMKEFQSALRLDPRHFPANLLLGRLLVTQQRPTDALPYLRRAAKLRPDSIDAHRFLADVYAQLGQPVNGRRELAEAERLRSQGGSRLGSPTEYLGDVRKQR